MKIGVLGPLSVNGEGAQLPRRDRVVLAALVVNRDGMTSAAQLADALWKEALPDSWKKVVQSCVVRLRRRLGAPAIVTSTQGYRLDTNIVEVDCWRFEKLVTDGRSHLASGRPEDAARLLAGALALWRGRPLAVLEEWDSGRILAQRFEELRHDAEELSLEAAIASGRHAEALSLGHALVTERPLREGRWALLAQAQYLSGRQADALRTLQRARTVLIEQTGLDPSPPLQELERRILHHDADVGAPVFVRPQPPGSTPHAATGTTVPMNLPAPVGSFVGRESELSELARSLAASRLLVITGPPGVGKTRTALELAARAAADYPDGVWHVGLAAASNLDDLNAELASTFDVAAARNDTQAAIENNFGDRTTLLVLDNCDHLAADAARLAVRFLEAARGLTVLATSRTALSVPGEKVWQLPPMALPAADEVDPRIIGETDAARLFIARATGADRTFEPATNASQVASVCRALDGLPLALELAAARLTTLRLEDISRALQTELGTIDSASRVGPEHHRTLHGMVEWSYRLLPPNQKQMYERLAVFEGGWNLQSAAAIAAPHLSERAASIALDGLVASSLVQATGTEHGHRFHMLTTVREHASGKLDTRDSNAADRHAQFFGELSTDLFALWKADKTQQAALMFSAERQNMRLALRTATRSGDDATVAKLLSSYQLWALAGLHHEAYEALAALFQVEPELPIPLLADALHARAVSAVMHDVAAARLAFGREAALRGEVGDRMGQLDALCSLAFLYTDDPAAASQLIASAAAAGRSAGLPVGSANALLGHLHLTTMQLDRARECLVEAIAEYETKDNVLLASATRIRLAEVAWRQGRLAEARALLADSESVVKRFAESTVADLASFYSGLVARDEGNQAEAAERLLASLRFAEGVDYEVGVTLLAAASIVDNEELAAETLGIVVRVVFEGPYPGAVKWRSDYDTLADTLRSDLGRARFDHHFSRGHTSGTLDEATRDVGKALAELAGRNAT